MIFSIFTLFVALSLSLVSAYYSVLGLTAIFAAAVIPVVIMGVTLEVAKITTTVWLHYFWEQSSLKIKLYLVPAVAFLMILTSLGSFGFLSKAHTEQSVPSGDIQAQVLLFDEKIQTQRDNIDSARKAIVQLNAAVDQTMSRSDTESGAVRAAAIRKSQAKERAALTHDIDVAQAAIVKLQEARAPVASNLRKVEADVGPIRYIAALIYGDNVDQNMLESAVRIVIIIIVLVFDPLAIVLILAATTSMDWARNKRVDDKNSKLDSELADAAAAVDAETKDVDSAISQLEKELALTKETINNQTLSWEEKSRELNAANIKLGEITEYVETLAVSIQQLQDNHQSAVEANIETRTELCEMISAYDDLVERHEEVLSEYAELQSIVDSKVAATELISVTESEVDVSIVDDVVADPIPEVDLVINEDVDEVPSDLIDLLFDTDDSAASKSVVEIEPFEFDEFVFETEPNQPTEPITEVESEISDEQWDQLYASVQTAIIQPEPAIEVASEVVESLERPGDYLIHDEPTYQIFPELIESIEVPVEEVVAVTDLVIELGDSIPETIGSQPEELPLPIAVEADHESNDIVEPANEPVVESEPEVIQAEVTEEPEVIEEPQYVAPTRPSFVPPEITATQSKSTFGSQFPNNPVTGDIFLRIDVNPSRLFKWVGNSWIEINKNSTDAYIYDAEYIKTLIKLVESGEVDIDDLTEVEQEEIESILRGESSAE